MDAAGAIEFRHLRYFIAVAEEMHFGRAAERLHMAQSPLSHQIRQLERRLGVTLLERDHHVMGLTDAGTVFLDDARAVLAGLERAVDRTQRAGAGEVGTICVGYVPEMVGELLPQCLKAHRQRYPEITVELSQGTTGELLTALRERRVDVGYCRVPGPLEDLEYEELVREELYVAVPDGYRPGPAPVDLAGLADQTVLLPAYQTVRGLREDIEGACAAAGLALRSTREVASLTALLLMVAAGAGVALVPAGMARSFPLPGVQFNRMSRPATTCLGISWRRGEPSHVVSNFVGTARSLAPEAQPIRTVRAG